MNLFSERRSFGPRISGLESTLPGAGTAAALYRLASQRDRVWALGGMWGLVGCLLCAWVWCLWCEQLGRGWCSGAESAVALSAPEAGLAQPALRLSAPEQQAGEAAARAEAAAGTADQALPGPGSQDPISDARQWLRSLRLDDSHFAVVTDGEPVAESEQELLWKLLYWARRLDPVDLERWVRRHWDFQRLAANVSAERGQLFELRGRVRRVEPLTPPAEVAQRLELPQYFRCECLLEPGGKAAVVYTTAVPPKWRKGAELFERTSAAGLFLKLAAADPQQPQPVFVTPRVAWYPETLLGRLGMDVGLLEEVRPRGPIRAEEREAFYQMLAAAGRTGPGELLQAAGRELEASGRGEYSVVPLFNEPETQVGRLVYFTGTARQVIRVVVDDADIRARFGIDHYYQLAVVTEESSPHPIYFCVLEVPKGMPQGSGSGFGERVTVAGFFFKKWLYRPSGSYTNSPEPDAPAVTYQPAPLMLGRDVVWHPRTEPPTDTLAAAIAGALFVVALAGVWLAIWYYGRTDRQFERTTMVRTLAGEGPLQLDELAVSAPLAPEALTAASDATAEGDEFGPRHSRPNGPTAAGPEEPGGS